MIGWLFLAFGIALGVAVAPIFSVEVFVVSLASTTAIPWILIGAAVATGQVAGKTLYYLGARGSIRLPAPLHRHLRRQHQPSARWSRWRAKSGRIRGWLDGLRAWIEKLRERCRCHPYWLNGTYGVSALIGLPPFMAITVLAGLLRMRPSVFITTGLAGRFVRFSALAAAPAMFTAWLPI